MAAFTVIDHTELGASASSYDVTSIPSSYDHLYLVTSIRTDDAQLHDQIGLRLNGDTGTNYSRTSLANGGSLTSTRSSGDTSIEYLYGAAGTSILADTFGTMTTWIPNYANTTNFKQTLHKWACENNVTTANWWLMGLTAGLWSDTSAIDQITLAPIDADDFVQYSTFTLYGVTGA